MTIPQTLFGLFLLHEFWIELLLFSLLFIRTLKKRSHFSMRFAAMLLLGFAISSYWNYPLSRILWLNFIRYGLLFFLLFLLIWVCYQCTVGTALFCAMASYAAQHFFYKCYSITRSFFPASDTTSILEWFLHYLLVLSVILALLHLMLKRQMPQNISDHFHSNRHIPLCVALLLSCVIFSNLVIHYAQNTPQIILNLCYLYDALSCLLILYLLFGQFQLDQTIQEKEVITQLMQQEHSKFTQNQETIDLINLKCHDMRHLLRRLESENRNATPEEIASLQNLISLYDFNVDTGNAVLNLILADKNPICQAAQIRLHCIADASALSFMNENDLYSLFSNAIENAITAVTQIKEPEKRTISLNIHQAMGFVSICMENYYTGEIRLSHGLPQTSTHDEAYHGYGVKSMQYIVEKYHGTLQIKTDQNIFTLNILLPI